MRFKWRAFESLLRRKVPLMFVPSISIKMQVNEKWSATSEHQRLEYFSRLRCRSVYVACVAFSVSPFIVSQSNCFYLNSIPHPRKRYGKITTEKISPRFIMKLSWNFYLFRFSWFPFRFHLACEKKSVRKFRVESQSNFRAQRWKLNSLQLQPLLLKFPTLQVKILLWKFFWRKRKSGQAMIHVSL